MSAPMNEDASKFSGCALVFLILFVVAVWTLIVASWWVKP